MGITGLNKFLKCKSPRAFTTMPLSDFSDKCIAVDANLWLHSNMIVARKKVLSQMNVLEEPEPEVLRFKLYESLLEFIIKFLNYRITPVFVFDGPHPIEKEQTQISRKNKNKIQLQKIINLKQQENVSRAELFQAFCNYNSTTFSDIEGARELLTSIGIPCLSATGDGEYLCSMLCHEQIVAGVFSADTDNFAHGCPLLITDFSKNMNYSMRYFNVVRMDYILQDLNITLAQFVDMCIMIGCDHNDGLKGVGPITAYKLVRKHWSIDTLPKNYDISNLNHVRCRELFAVVLAREVSQTDINVGIGKPTAIADERLRLHYDNIILGYQYLNTK